ncbi:MULTISPECIES: hypothetical protein [Desulfofundulus]|jgi:hypothetical protein|uniref:Uncharacterized protein n=2 Tax=Desulfofundulus TaxID=2282741 RepID=A0A1M6JJW0_9FIRM|nr:hypothetical protein [Desulfofundulus thermosubterraneus]AEG14133.1 hypothetical protein Desku_0515 [Desulfofundulus kuznetsovii DSM 6115]SHJ46915.1 hypothetical protein SAMN02745219_02626 [Desulfofundulus thermosubterraneus DSM 16057]
MAVERLVEEIKKLTPKQKEELFRKLGITLPIENEEFRGGPDDPLAELIGMFKGPGTGSRKYKEDLYGGDSIVLLDERGIAHQCDYIKHAIISG